MKPEHLQAFHMAFIEGKKNQEISEDLNISIHTIASWRKTGWWQFLHDLWFSEQQEAFKVALMKHDQDLNKAIGEIVNGERSDDRSVNTVGKILDVRMKMGAAPLIEQKTAVQITNQTINNKGTINIAKAKAELTPEEMLEMATTGRIPDKVRGE